MLFEPTTLATIGKLVTETLHKNYLVDATTLFREVGLEMGFRRVESGPLVRSSYRAEEQISTLAPGLSRRVSPPLQMSSTISTT